MGRPGPGGWVGCGVCPCFCVIGLFIVDGARDTRVRSASWRSAGFPGSGCAPVTYISYRTVLLYNWVQLYSTVTGRKGVKQMDKGSRVLCATCEIIWGGVQSPETERARTRDVKTKEGEARGLLPIPY